MVLIAFFPLQLHFMMLMIEDPEDQPYYSISKWYGSRQSIASLVSTLFYSPISLSHHHMLEATR